MSYTTKNNQYGNTNSYSACSNTYSNIQKKKSKSSGCCGRGCNPCVDDFKM